MTLAEAAAALMLVGLVAYALLGGADFGGGVWDLLARGPRQAAQRTAIERALAPVWEANHVWLIFVVVLLFTCFPTAFAAASLALHVPLTLLLIGIVLRGSAFVFRQYGGAGWWGRVFAGASVLSPLFLGVTIGAITAGDGDLALGWYQPFPLAVGLLTLVLFAFLAAVYLAREADDSALAGDFRRRALAAGLLLGPCAAVAALAAGPGTRHWTDTFFGSWWTWPLQLTTAAAALSALAALLRRRYSLARIAAATQVALIIVGWGLAQRPFLIPPTLTIQAAAAPSVTLRLALIIVGGGSALLIPSVY